MKRKYSDEDVLKVMEQQLEERAQLIKELQEAVRPQWIPVMEGLPETSGIMLEDEKILISLADGTRTISFYVNTAQGKKIFFDGWDTYHPIAWMPLPEPYNPPVL